MKTLTNTTETEIRQLKEDFSNYISKNKTPSVEGFQSQFEVGEDLIYHSFFYNCHIKLRSIKLAHYEEILNKGHMTMSEFEKMVAREKARPIKRSVKNMYKNLQNKTWSGLPPTKEELYDVADYEKEIIRKDKKDPSIYLSTKHFAIYSDQSYSTIREAISDGELTEYPDGILLNSPESDAFLKSVRYDLKEENLRQTNITKNLDNHLKGMRVATFENNLISRDIVEYCYFNFLDNFARSMLEVGFTMSSKFELIIKDGIMVNKTPMEMTKSILEEFNTYTETKLKLLKKEQEQQLDAKLNKFYQEQRDATINQVQDHAPNQQSEAGSQRGKTYISIGPNQ